MEKIGLILPLEYLDILSERPSVIMVLLKRVSNSGRRIIHITNDEIARESGYANRNQGGGYNQGGNNNYQRTPYQAPAKKEFNLAEECETYATVYTTLRSVREANGISIEDVKDYLGGWTTSLKIELSKNS